MSTEIHLTEADVLMLHNRVDAEIADILAELVANFPGVTPMARFRRLYEKRTCFHINYYDADCTPEEIVEMASELGLRGAVIEDPCVHWPKVYISKEQVVEIFGEEEEDEDEIVTSRWSR